MSVPTDDPLGAPPPADQPDRDRIRTSLAANLFVEAGAGAGKTASLVARIVELVRSGVDIGAVAAITFTDKAAAELRHRLRVELSNAAASAADLFEHERFSTALAALDHAPIGTLHAFARRVLSEFPIAAGLPPGFRVLDEIESSIQFDERWDELIERLLADPYPAAGPIAGGVELVALCDFDGFGLRKAFRRVATDFAANWDLVEARVDTAPPPPLALDLSELRGAIAAACRVDTPADDTQAATIAELRAQADVFERPAGLLAQLSALAATVKLLGKPARIGNKQRWKAHGGDDALDDLRDREVVIRDLASDHLEAARRHRRSLVGAILGGWVLDAARQRAAEGTLAFHDLLVLARRLVATRPDVRRALHRRYQRILLDEFQDTDPIQLEIAVRLAAAPDDPGHHPGRNWRSLTPLPGRLFIVGDPKQSIYRFRRADIAQYLRAADQLGATPAHLTANFRSSAPVVTWINHTFQRLIAAIPDVQPAYQPLDAQRHHHRHHGSVSLLGVSEHADLAEQRATAETLRWREAADAADAVATALHQRWLVSDGPHLRECRPGDITVLLPARTSLAALEAALAERGIPFRAENSSVVYTTTDVRHVMLALRAASDATDELALVAALRTGLYGCSDVELLEWRQAGGAWSIWRAPPDGHAAHPVGEAIAHVRSLAERAAWCAPADLIAALVDERRLLDAELDSADGRDAWRRLRYVIEQARAWSDAGGHGLRRYLAWVRRQAAESRTADTVLPEHDTDAVRIMTIHAAKGLEFPITVVSGLTTIPAGRPAASVVWHDDSWTIASREGDDLYDDFRPLDEQMSDAERRRLLYVACTRAVDHLVVSLHRLPRDSPQPDRMPSAALLATLGEAAGTDGGAAELVAEPGEFAVAPPHLVAIEWADQEQWRAEHARAARGAARRTTVSATTLADDLADIAGSLGLADSGAHADEGLAKGPVDLDLPAWQRGRYGTAIGRAVHATLQFCDLHDGAEIPALAAAQCASEGIIGHESTVAALARSALDAPIVRDAARGEHHRELYVAAAVGDRLLEGYVDLLVATSNGWAIVDYKTDAWPSDAVRSERLARYRRQLAAYAVALEAVLGEPITSGILVHCRTDAAAEQIELDQWQETIELIRQAVAA